MVVAFFAIAIVRWVYLKKALKRKKGNKKVQQRGNKNATKSQQKRQQKGNKRQQKGNKKAIELKLPIIYSSVCCTFHNSTIVTVSGYIYG